MSRQQVILESHMDSSSSFSFDEQNHIIRRINEDVFRVDTTEFLQVNIPAFPPPYSGIDIPPSGLVASTTIDINSTDEENAYDSTTSNSSMDLTQGSSNPLQMVDDEGDDEGREASDTLLPVWEEFPRLEGN